MSELIIALALLGLTTTNVYTLYVLFRLSVLYKSKDLWEYSRLMEKPKKEKKEIPNIVEVPLY